MFFESSIIFSCADLTVSKMISPKWKGWVPLISKSFQWRLCMTLKSVLKFSLRTIMHESNCSHFTSLGNHTQERNNKSCYWNTIILIVPGKLLRNIILLWRFATFHFALAKRFPHCQVELNIFTKVLLHRCVILFCFSKLLKAVQKNLGKFQHKDAWSFGLVKFW